jgi:hypothetical protein
MIRKPAIPVFSKRVYSPQRHDEADISSDEEIKLHRVSQKGLND